MDSPETRDVEKAKELFGKMQSYRKRAAILPECPIDDVYRCADAVYDFIRLGSELYTKPSIADYLVNRLGTDYRLQMTVISDIRNNASKIELMDQEEKDNSLEKYIPSLNKAETLLQTYQALGLSTNNQAAENINRLKAVVQTAKQRLAELNTGAIVEPTNYDGEEEPEFTEDTMDRLTNLPPEVRARIKARAAQNARENQEMLSTFDQQAQIRIEQATAELEEAIDKMADIFTARDRVVTLARTPDGKPILNSTPHTLIRFENGKGDIFYLKINQGGNTFSKEQLSSLSRRIKAEEAEFKALDLSEQTRIKREGDVRYEAYLSNERLKEQFQSLKSSPKDRFIV